MVAKKLSGPWAGFTQLQQQKALLPSGIEHLSSSHSAYRLVTVTGYTSVYLQEMSE